MKDGCAWRLSLLLAAVATTMTEGAISSAKTTTHDSNHHRELIINGQIAEEGRYPYFSTLHHECGGALIAPDTILTAGHCLPHHLDSVIPHVGTFGFLNNKEATTADNSNYDDTQDSDRYYKIVNMTRHSHWKSLGDDEFRHDMALLFLDRPPLSNGHHVFVKLNRNPHVPDPGQSLTAMGVGWTSSDYEHAKKSHVLREVGLEYLPNDQCKMSTDAVESSDETAATTTLDDGDDDDTHFISYQGRIHADHLCTTGGPDNSRDACAYDSGSPIIVKGANSNEDVLVALVSWGEGCADPNFPAVNTRISDGLDFINESVCKYSAYPPSDFGCDNKNDENNSASGSYSVHHLLGLGALILVIAAGLSLIQRIAASKHQLKSHGTWSSSLSPRFVKLQKQFSSSSETEYLYQDSPASSIGSEALRGGHVSYDAIATLTV